MTRVTRRDNTPMRDDGSTRSVNPTIFWESFDAAPPVVRDLLRRCSYNYGAHQVMDIFKPFLEKGMSLEECCMRMLDADRRYSAESAAKYWPPGHPQAAGFDPKTGS